MNDHLFRIKKSIKLAGRNYTVREFLAHGGSGEVYIAEDGERLVALKAFFPYYQLNILGAPNTQQLQNIAESVEFQQREYASLLKLSHPNIVKVLAAGDVPLSTAEQKSIPVKDITSLPVIITELVDGKPLLEAIRDFKLSAANITYLLQRVASALYYLHVTHTYMHTDIKSANIMVRRADHEPILIDFALCKNLNFAEVSQTEQTRLVGDWDLFPKDLRTDHRLKLIKESQGTRRDIYDLCFPGLDLFQYGKLLRSLVNDCASLFDERELGYLEALAAQMTDWESVQKWRPADLTGKIDRFGSQHFLAFGVPELTATTATERTVMIPPGIGIPVTKRIESILHCRSFRRLSTINQLCLVNYVYPAGDYKRVVHVLYSYELARQLVLQLYACPLFRTHFDTSSVHQLLLTTLLHDINHFPFLHILQEANIPGLDKLGVLDLFCNGEATGERASGQPCIYELLDQVGIDPARFKRLVFQHHHEQSGPFKEVDQIINSIINSGVDIDKLSYLFLDAYFTGVRYGTGMDLPCILKAATLVQLDNGPHLAFTERAFQALENVVMTRFWNFRSIYWHHTNRALMAMILSVVRELYVDQKQNFQEYLLDTMWRTDLDAVRYLDERFKRRFGCPSIIGGIVEDRGCLYRRIYTVRSGEGDAIDDDIYVKCRKLSYEQEKNLRKAITQELSEMLSLSGITEQMVLLDIPQRQIHSGGGVYIATDDGEAIPLSRMSEPIRGINKNYDALVQRMRLFVSPKIAEQLGGRRGRIGKRGAIQKVMQSALARVLGSPEVQ